MEGSAAAAATVLAAEAGEVAAVAAAEVAAAVAAEVTARGVVGAARTGNLEIVQANAAEGA